ncbi:MAG: transcription termination factor Rho [Candidatus Levybacteria bacterium RIFCSPHIGHO2_02_FULL_37_18]|nr:MAG: transcription termination factor Rho [Candidatus Levybacteria bacterium RIFCSPHIGHO2_02_FULL_37_18]OGH33274.1 MAG: transcription termination factor Rho [Candidatus Levybacteria bacterium RIFCSPLOWO2_01_FULL_37_20]OGH44841.1 MAG: transcription termination factor Rho [Candidatus Levybacteria bacterium RIFCSPLOWO2_02_FULL_37_18]OGH51689.1 MAG: transcription termination factor Rho [Candidatus Levybacteria bacterium RIFCSPLOWO2_12_FULL_37_7]
MSKINPDQIGTKTKPTEKNTTPSKVEKIIGEPKVPQEVSSQQSSKQSSNEDLGDSSYGRTQNRMYSNDVLSREQNTEPVVGILDIQPEGHGFLRPKFIPSSRDIYISQSQIRRFLLRPGDSVAGVARPPKDTERYFGLLKVETVNGIPADDSFKRPHFDDLTPIYPKAQVVLATGKTPLSTRILDLVSPIGFGQRGMVVSPPKAGKTTILKEIAAGISQNFPKAHLMAALIGERPEEVTDISQSVKGDVVASNFDEPPESQTRVAEITLDRAKRLVEMGIDVIILLDSITRLARAYNLSIAPSGRTLSGGFDPAALWPAKRFFGAARNCQEGGSLTIIGTALVETGSRMDDLIYEEFKGTGNMELHLDRKLADRRIFPAINVERSGTRQEELILSEKDYKRIVTMRRMLDMLGSDERTQMLIDRLSKTATNEEFLEGLGKE